MRKEEKRNLGDLIAHWNLEHTDRERKAHLVWMNRFLKLTEFDRFMTAHLGQQGDLWVLGWPKTLIDLKLRKPYANRTYRHAVTGGRVRGLSTIHIAFARQAGVYNYDKHAHDVQVMTSACKNAKQAAKISKWSGWDDTCCEYVLRTDAKHCAYRGRNFTTYAGDPEDSFAYGPDWNDVHRRLGDVLYRMVWALGMLHVKEQA